MMQALPRAAALYERTPEVLPPSHTSLARPLLEPVSDYVPRTDLIVDAIRDAILDGRLEPGQGLVERELAQRLGVSKTPIREALKVLSHHRLVTLTPYRGAVVSPVSTDLAQSVYEVRLLLEPEAARKAVSAQTRETINEARAALDHGKAAGENNEYTRLSASNRRFHYLLYAPCGNPVLCSLLDTIQDQVALITTHAWRKRATWSYEAGQHDAILEAVERGDADVAAERLRRHIDEALTRLLEVLSP